MKTATAIKEKLHWFQVLASFYEIAEPYIDVFIGIKCKALENRTVDTDAIEQNAHVLRKLLSLIKNLPEPPDAELSRTRSHLETALVNCINGSEALVKYLNYEAGSTASQVQLDNLINAIVLAREYIESIYKRLHLMPEPPDA